MNHLVFAGSFCKWWSNNCCSKSRSFNVWRLSPHRDSNQSKYYCKFTRFEKSRQFAQFISSRRFEFCSSYRISCHRVSCCHFHFRKRKRTQCKTKQTHNHNSQRWWRNDFQTRTGLAALDSWLAVISPSDKWKTMKFRISRAFYDSFFFHRSNRLLFILILISFQLASHI